MVLSPEQERVRTLLQDTITLLCRNGLSYQNEFDIKALIGITVDKENCFLIDIKDTIKNNANKDSDEENEDDVPQSPARKRKRNKRRRSSRGESDLESLASDSVPHTPVNNRVKAEEDEDSDDAIIIKDEPGYDNSNYGNNQDILGNLAQAQLFPATQESLQWDAGSPSFSIGSSQQQHHHQQSQHMNTSQNLGASTSTPSLQQQQQVYMDRAADTALAVGAAMTPPVQQCTVCDKQFRTRHQLQQHVDGVHDKLKQDKYTCNLCGKGYRWPSPFYYHKKRCRGPAGAVDFTGNLNTSADTSQQSIKSEDENSLSQYGVMSQQQGQENTSLFQYGTRSQQQGQENTALFQYGAMPQHQQDSQDHGVARNPSGVPSNLLFSQPLNFDNTDNGQSIIAENSGVTLQQRDYQDQDQDQSTSRNPPGVPANLLFSEKSSTNKD